jgi:hypothetical protein
MSTDADFRNKAEIVLNCCEGYIEVSNSDHTSQIVKLLLLRVIWLLHG